ncbi:hypothetical protein [Paraburkholderia caffeinilytica]|uniref:hypothetical protein n=1 Tax=Paraburkholderia caffeinilytica TaxID=1761016 RepID=UPI003D9FF3C4
MLIEGRLLTVVHVLTGAFMALFVAPAVDRQWLQHGTLEMQCAIAFVPGALGPLAVEIVIRLVQRRGDDFADRIADWLARWLSGGRRPDQ